MIGIINTGMGNVPSISSALKKLDCNFILCSNKNDLDRVSKIILPGVGSFKLFHEKIQNNTASQIFTKKGPLAFLPISGTQTSIVYSLNNQDYKKNENIILKIIINSYLVLKISRQSWNFRT